MKKARGRKVGSRNGVYATRRSPEEAERLFLDNMGLVGYTIKTMEVPFTDDAMQDGYIGLWKAALAFDDTHGHQFSSYAIPAIRGEIIRGWNRMNKSDTPVFSLDYLYSAKMQSGLIGGEEELALYDIQGDAKAEDMLNDAEIRTWLCQMLDETESEVVRRRSSGETIVDINAAFGKPRGWAESQLLKAKKIIKKDYLERVKNFG